MRRVAAAAALVLLAAGCAQGGDEVRVNVLPGSAAPAPETSAPAASGPQVVDTVATGLEAPWGLAFLPDGAAVVTERDTAQVLVIAAGTHEVSEVGTVGEAAPQGEGGLLGVAVSPSYASDARLFFYVSTATDNRIVSATLRDGKLSGTKPVLTGIPLGPIHDGGRLAFGPDGFLYASTGETGQPELAQDTDSLAGKILRITPAGRPAPGNPFGSPVYSFGHRNVQGLAFTDDGTLWASEFGQSTYDELNRIQAGANYGWPAYEGTGGAAEGYTDPQATWSTDVASPSGLAWADGALWMGALRGNRLWRIPVTDGVAAQPEAYLVGDHGRLRTVVTAPDGTLWVTTSNTDGRGSPTDGDDQILVVSPTG